jgi:CO dehydrogenase nickel-insertion accessory protein CooC1
MDKQGRGYVIALAGKGGTGKTTVAALLVRLLKEKEVECGGDADRTIASEASA